MKTQQIIVIILLLAVTTPFVAAVPPAIQHDWERQCNEIGAGSYTYFLYEANTDSWQNEGGGAMDVSSSRTSISFTYNLGVLGYFGPTSFTPTNQTSVAVSIPDDYYSIENSAVVFCLGPAIPVASDVCTPGQQRGINASLCCQKLYHGDFAGLFQRSDYGVWVYSAPHPTPIEWSNDGTAFQYSASVPVTMLDSETANFDPVDQYSGKIDGTDAIWMCEDNRTDEEIPQFGSTLTIALIGLLGTLLVIAKRHK